MLKTSSVGMNQAAIKAVVEDTLRSINEERKANKDGWYTLHNNMLHFSMKAYNTWVQRFEVTNSYGKVTYRTSSPMGMKVREFNEWLRRELHCLKVFYAE